MIASGAGLRSFPKASVYGATKAAQVAWARALRHELGGSGVSVTTVMPGELETHLHDHQRDDLPYWRQDKYAMPARPLAERVVDAVEKDQAEVYYPGSVKWLRVFQGFRGKGNTNEFRYAGRLSFRVYGAQTGFFYRGTSLGKVGVELDGPAHFSHNLGVLGIWCSRIGVTQGYRGGLVRY